jgi:hypothetical protein
MQVIPIKGPRILSEMAKIKELIFLYGGIVNLQYPTTAAASGFDRNIAFFETRFPLAE